MLYGGITCLMVQNVSLTDGMRNAIAAVAAGMLRRQGEKGAERGRLKHDDIEGELKTQFGFACLGSFTGVEFTAKVETDLGKGKAAFIVDPRLALLEPEEIAAGRWENVTERLLRAEASAYN